MNEAILLATENRLRGAHDQMLGHIKKRMKAAMGLWQNDLEPFPALGVHVPFLH